MLATSFAEDDVTAAATDDAQSEPTSMRTEAGHVEGYMTLPLGDEVIDATYLADKSGREYGKVLILPDFEGNIDSYDLVHTLRIQLAEAGWATMTVELNYPDEARVMLSAEETSDADATVEDIEAPTDAESEESGLSDLDENAARVAAAIAYLNAQQPGLVVVICLGKSAELSATALAQAGKENALIWISPQWGSPEPPDTEFVLDITTSDLTKASVPSAQHRALMMRKNIAQYSQRQIVGATSGFYGFEQPVFNQIRHWLHKHFAAGASS